MKIGVNMGIDSKIIISVDGKRKYLEKLIGKTLKILHLIEENVPVQDYIYGQMLEINAANILFDNELTEIVVKYKVIYDNHESAPFTEIRKQVLEIKNKINYLLKKISK